MPPEITRHIAFFITPHGYGHATRACAVMNAIYQRLPGVCFEIFTRVPAWLFKMSLEGPFQYHEALTDVGLAQANSMVEDLPETIRRLDALLPYRPAVLKDLARQVRETNCEIILCDIAPLGIAVGREAGLPSVLEENFTWDWIYEAYLAGEPRFRPFIDALRDLFHAADYHIQTEPVCAPDPAASLVTRVVSRKPRAPANTTRRRLGIPQEAPLVLITTGGIITQIPFLHRLETDREIRFLVPGGSDHHEQRGSLVLIPHHSDFYHPDLVEASNVIVGKLGYSTLAEAHAAGLPFVYVPRERFRESLPMARFAREEMRAVELDEARFFTGEWLDLLPELIARPRRRPSAPNGADQIAEYVEVILPGESWAK